jgi:GrpB-like predicted nucleotidyltransferase (UPF0157 family)
MDNKKELSEMTLSELWDLFPIVLKEYNPDYTSWYETEKQSLLEHFDSEIIRINHVGSTAVPGLLSKPTVDILMEIDEGRALQDLDIRLLTLGWLPMKEMADPFWLIFAKGYTNKGFAQKIYHLHIRYPGNWNELYFRDYLIAYPDIAKQYGKIKQDLLQDYEHDRDGYTLAKTEFISKFTDLAKKEFQNKYNLN